MSLNTWDLHNMLRALIAEVALNNSKRDQTEEVIKLIEDNPHIEKIINNMIDRRIKKILLIDEE